VGALHKSDWRTARATPYAGFAAARRRPTAAARRQSAAILLREQAMKETMDKTIRVNPGEAAKRRGVTWRGLTVEIVQFTAAGPFEYGFRAPMHLFVVIDRAVRSGGETLVEGLRPSTRRDFGQTMTFVPAGHRFHGSFVPRVLPRATYFYIDPESPIAPPELGFADLDFAPMLFFHDPALWITAQKLIRLIEAGGSDSLLYGETLTSLLMVELARLHPAHRPQEPRPAPGRGGLAGWQQRLVCDYLQDNFDRDVSLAELAAMARLSATHFCRAFTHSLGMPPHRYQIHRRVEQAKMLLADEGRSVTEVAMACGFGAPSNFSTTFRRVTGLTPRDYRRGLS
jgi:AraC family transcriptional regulator